AKNGKEAVEICMANRNVDIVLMNIKMPIMNGYEATAKIKSVFPNLTIIAQTAYTSAHDKEMAIKYGCNDFISKPIDKDELIEMIDKQLNIS
ncbi:MAG: response regulator, partial [Bacteroidales bacterium]|nr:response regulator [Bacteroidales bacterium]